MAANEKNRAVRLFMLVAHPRLADRAEELFRLAGQPPQYRFHSEGTASSEIMDMLGLEGSDKSIIMGCLPKHFADDMLKMMRRELRLGSKNSGIAFTIPLTGVSAAILRMLTPFYENAPEEQRKEAGNVTESKYAMIAAIVNRGFSNAVMDCARPVGARGGTVIHSRQLGGESLKNFLGENVPEEKDIVLIVATSDDKMAIMHEIGEHCGLHSEAQGIVLSLPIETAIGLAED